MSVPSVPRTLLLFARARFGLHAASPVVDLRRLAQMELAFTCAEPPCQVDGEPLHGMRFQIHSVPDALRVITGGKFAQK